MSIPFSQLPGRHERHYRRKLDNPLFPGGPLARDDDFLLDCQRRDHEELIAFLDELRSTVQRAVDLKPNEGSEVILALKEQLDRLYEQSAGLAEDHAANQAAIVQLVDVIMRNVEHGAGGDPQAIDELAQERAARQTHFELLKQPLVADLLHPQSAIGKDELAATLLSESEDAVAAALQLFDREQTSELYVAANQCVESQRDVDEPVRQRLTQIGAYLAQLGQDARVN